MSSAITKRVCGQVGLHQHVLFNPVLYNPAGASISRYNSTTTSSASSSADLSNVPPPTPTPPRAVNPSRTQKIIEKVKEEVHRFISGSKELGRNTKTAATLLRGMSQGQVLNRRDRIMMVTTVADLIRMVPFVAIVIIPFAEFALPVLLKVFPNMLPSTFTSASQKEANRARKLQAKLKVIEILQAASESLVLRGKLDSKEAHESLIAFMKKVSTSQKVTLDEVIKVSQVFRKEFSLESLDRAQLASLTRFFGMPSLGNAFILQESLKFKWNLMSKDDAHIIRDGIESLSPAELEEAAVSRGFSHSNPHQDQKLYVQEWITLSQEKVPPYLLLLSRTHYFSKNMKPVTTDITPPVIAPYIPPLSNQMNPRPSVEAKPAADEMIIDIPEKEIVPIEFKNLSHELTYNPVVSKLWDRLARYTSELKKETFGGREEEVIHLGDASGDKLSTVITAELRRYLQAMFVALDKNGDRRLSVDEVEHGLNATDFPIPHDEVIALVKKHDYDGDQHLSFDEFVDCLLYLRKNRT